MPPRRRTHRRHWFRSVAAGARGDRAGRHRWAWTSRRWRSAGSSTRADGFDVADALADPVAQFDALVRGRRRCAGTAQRHGGRRRRRGGVAERPQRAVEGHGRPRPRLLHQPGVGQGTCARHQPPGGGVVRLVAGAPPGPGGGDGLARGRRRRRRLLRQPTTGLAARRVGVAPVRGGARPRRTRRALSPPPRPASPTERSIARRSGSATGSNPCGGSSGRDVPAASTTASATAAPTANGSGSAWRPDPRLDAGHEAVDECLGVRGGRLVPRVPERSVAPDPGR